MRRNHWKHLRKYETQKASTEFPDFQSENYLDLEIQTWTENDRPYLRIYKGKSGKHLIYSYFQSEESRKERIENFKQSAKARRNFKEERRKARKNIENPYEVGDILASSWGYEQTNIDFFKVKDTTKKSVKLVRIGQKRTDDDTHYLTEYVIPDPDKEGTKVHTKRVQPGGGVKISSFQYASKWHGKKLLQTHWH